MPVFAIYAASLRMDAQQFGAIAVLVTAYTTATLISDSGVETSATFLISRVSHDEREKYLATLSIIRVCLAILASSLLVGLQSHLISSTSASAAVVTLLAVATAVLAARNSAHRIRMRISGDREPLNLLLEKAVASSAFLLWVIFGPASVYEIVIGFFVCTMLGSLIAAARPHRRELAFSGDVAARLLRVAAPFIATALATALIWRVPVFVLSKDSTAAAGFFALAVYPVQMLSTVPVLSAPLLLVHKRFSSTDIAKGEKLSLVCGIFCTVLALAIGFAAITLDGLGLDNHVWSTLMVLSLSAPFVFRNPIVTARIRTLGSAWKATLCHCAGAVIVGLLIYPMVTRWESEGAALAVVIGEIAISIGLLIVSVKLDYNRNRSIVTKAVAASAVATAVAVCIVWIACETQYGAQIVISILVLLLALLADQRYSSIPIVLRPAFLLTVAAIIASFFAWSLTERGYWAYFSLWAVQMVGFTFGMLLPVSMRRPHNEPGPLREFNTRRLTEFGWGILICSGIFMLGFIMIRGVPILQHNIEQGRVDAASTGTGYLRLLANMCVPAALILCGTRARNWGYSVVIAALMVLALGNRSPLVYLAGGVLIVCMIRTDVRYASVKAIVLTALTLAMVVSIGTYRIFSQSDFRSYAEYKDSLASNDYLAVALTSLGHYAQVVADNAVLAKRLVDEGVILPQLGETYLTLFITALPGQQLSLDRIIKAASDKSFVGGGTPPTLMGEGYVNFGYLGTFLSALAVMWFARQLALRANTESLSGGASGFTILLSYVSVWFVVAQVAGIAGASTFPLAGFVVIACCLVLSRLPRPCAVPKDPNPDRNLVVQTRNSAVERTH